MFVFLISCIEPIDSQTFSRGKEYILTTSSIAQNYFCINDVIEKGSSVRRTRASMGSAEISSYLQISGTSGVLRLSKICAV